MPEAEGEIRVGQCLLDFVVPVTLPYVIAILQKAKAELGWEAKYGIEEMVRDSWNWQKTNPKGIDFYVVLPHQLSYFNNSLNF